MFSTITGLKTRLTLSTMEHNNTELYERLEVPTTATQEEIKKAYRKAARKLMHASHDTSPSENEEYFKKASEAYNILSDKILREIYDKEGLESAQRQQNLDEGLIYRGEKLKAPTIEHKIYMPLEDFYFGKLHQFQLLKSAICPSCNGSIPTCESCNVCDGKRTIQKTSKMQINITPGTANDTTAFLGGKGSQMPDRDSGDIVVHINQLEHLQFERQGSKLILDVTVPLAKFTNGFELIFRHVGKHTIVCKSNPYIALKEGDLFKIKNEGMPKTGVQSGQFGDLFIRFHDDNSDKNTIYGNVISLISDMPCEVEGVRHVTAEQVDKIPSDRDEVQGCAQQ